MRRKGGRGMSEWKKVKLGEVCDTQYGFTASTVQQDTGTQFLRITDIVPQLIDWNTVPYCQIQEKDREKYLLHKGDIVVARTGATVGYAKYIKEDVPAVFASYLVRLLVNSIDVDRHYVGLCVESNLFKEYIQSISNGSAQPNANAQMISSFEINLPPLSTQHRIATILSRYDSLIENYQKQIKLLEEAAQRLYKEWFVDLHFPGHENTKIVDGVPEGWEKKSIGEIGTVITGKTPSTSNKENYGGSIPFITIPDMHTGIYPVSSVFLSEKGAESQSKKYIPQGALIVSCIGTAGLVCITKERCQTNQQINSLILDDKEMLHYMYFVFLSLKEHLNNIGSNGATMTNVNKSKFEGIDIVVPSSCIIRDFSQRTTPYFENIKSLQSQLRLLTEARDRLLPKLMNGEIAV